MQLQVAAPVVQNQGSFTAATQDFNLSSTQKLRIDDLEKKIDLLIQENSKLNSVIEMKVGEIDEIHIQYSQEIKRLQQQQQQQ